MKRVEGLSARRISERTGLARDTVARLLAAETPPKYSRAPAGSILDPFKDWICEQLKQDATVTSQRLREDAQELGYEGGRTIFDEYVREVRPRFLTRRTFQRTVYLEWPSEMVTLTPMLCAPLDLDPAEYEDTAEFQVRALKPMRTLLEKLSLLHHAATCSARDAASADGRCGRHYYDIYRLLDHAPMRAALDDRDQVERILVEMEAISTAQYGGWSERPERGYSHSPAFTNTGNPELREWLRARYDDAAPLLPTTASSHQRWPTFGRVLKRVERHSHLL